MCGKCPRLLHSNPTPSVAGAEAAQALSRSVARMPAIFETLRDLSLHHKNATPATDSHSTIVRRAGNAHRSAGGSKRDGAGDLTATPQCQGRVSYSQSGPTFVPLRP